MFRQLLTLKPWWIRKWNPSWQVCLCRDVVMEKTNPAVKTADSASNTWFMSHKRCGFLLLSGNRCCSDLLSPALSTKPPWCLLFNCHWLWIYFKNSFLSPSKFPAPFRSRARDVQAAVAHAARHLWVGLERCGGPSSHHRGEFRMHRNRGRS